MVHQQEKVNPLLKIASKTVSTATGFAWRTIQYCLRMGGKHAEEKHIRLLTDCAQICQISADFMIRGSEMHHEICAACAEVCGRCVDYCAALGAADEQMQECAEWCMRCEESCAEMAGD